MLHLLKVQLGRAGDATVHGFRSCFTDWATEQTNFPNEVREMALAHAVGDKIEAAYGVATCSRSGESWLRRGPPGSPERKLQKARKCVENIMVDARLGVGDGKLRRRTFWF
jgi:hypothetical protein